MGIIGQLLERRSGLPTPNSWLVDALTGGKVASGVTVNETSALGNTAVYSAVKILSETIASLPLPVYKRLKPRGKMRDPDHSLYTILHDLPNSEMTSFQLREVLQGHLCLWGNAYSNIVRDNGGRVREIWPLRPDRMQVIRKNGQLYYIYQVNGEQRVLSRAEIWHIAGWGFDGVVGYSPIRLAREAIGLALAAEEFGARWFSNGSVPSGLLIHPGKLDDKAAARLKESWEKAQSGLTNAHRTAVLEEGIQWQQIGMPPEDSQFLETRKFQVTEIARIFRIPPHMLADLDRATFSNIEHQGIEFVMHTIMPWLKRWEQAILRDLFTESERKTHFAEFLVDGLLRGDIRSRYEAYAVGRQNGWLSANDIREMENQNPIDNGDIYLVPLNMLPADALVAGSADQKAPGNPQDQDDGNRQVRSYRTVAEARTLRSAMTRRRIANSYRQVFEDAAARIIRREKADIMRMAKKLLTKRSAEDFLNWLDEFYQQHEDFVARNMAPVYNAMAEPIQAEAAEEIGAQPGIDDQMRQFIEAYLAAYVARHVGSSRGQLRAIAIETSPEELLAAIEQRLSEWEQTRPAKVASWEAVRFDNAVALQTYKQNGRTTKRWVTQGSSSCPYCMSLNGRTIHIDEPFVRQGDELKPEGVDAPLTFSGDYLHAPIHQGCDCLIVSA